MPPVVYIVGKDASFQTATGYLLRQAGYEVASYPSAEHFLGHLPNENVLGCILLKVRMQGLSGPALQKRLNDLGSALPVIFITRYLDIPATVRAIKAGASDFLMEPVSSDALLRAVERAVAIHEVALSRNVQLGMGLAHIAKLTPREKEVFELVVRGHSNKYAARLLGCAERTIKAHRHRVMEKMQVQSLAELVSLAERLGVKSTTELQPSYLRHFQRLYYPDLRWSIGG